MEAGPCSRTITDARSRDAGYKPLLAETLALSGAMYMKANDSRAAEASMIDAYRLADASRHDEVRAEVATSLVYVLGTLEGRFSDALAWYGHASAVLQRLGGHDQLQAWLLNNIGCAYFAHRDGEAAVRSLRDASKVKERILGLTNIDVGLSEGNLGTVLLELRRGEEALGHLDRALSILRKRLGNEHPDVALYLSNRREIFNSLGRHVEALQSFELATTIWERELGSETPNLAYALTGIGVSYLGQDKPASAVAPLERALKIRENQHVDLAEKAETLSPSPGAMWESKRDRVKSRAFAAEARRIYAKSALTPEVVNVDGGSKGIPPAEPRR